jgi:hypothetical protein
VTPASGKDAPRFFRSVCKTTGQAQASNAVTQHPNLQNHSTDANKCTGHVAKSPPSQSVVGGGSGLGW